MCVQFLRDTAKARINDAPSETLVLYREGFGYGIPEIPGAIYLDFLEYKNRYTLFDPKLIVVVGLNRIITPSNRCEMVNEYLQTMTPHIPKICLDTDPFIGEPWRLWFHYSIANCGNFGITYSFAIETEWKHWFYRDTPHCRLAGENIAMFISDTMSDIEPFQTEFVMEEPSSEEEKWYQQIKEDVFRKRDTPKLIINDLLKEANRHFGLNLSFDSFRYRPEDPLGLFPEPARFVLPDLGIYRFVIEENLRRMGTYNAVVNYENLSD